LTILRGVATRLPGIEIVEAFDKATNIKIDVTFNGAGPLLSSLELSKSGDLYLGIGTLNEMELALNKRLVEPTSIRKLGYLVPAIITQKDNPKISLDLKI